MQTGCRSLVRSLASLHKTTARVARKGNMRTFAMQDEVGI